MRRILVVEDDPTMSDYVKQGLAEAGHSVECSANGRDALYLASSGAYDLLVLDRMLPELDGLAIVKSLRAAGIATPALMLTAMGSVDERVRGLRAGADDYLTKPFSFEELLARVEALLRRPAGGSEPEETRLTCADLTVDLVERTVARGDRTILLKPREFQMLAYLLRRKGRVVTRTMLLEGVWDYHFDPQTNVIDVHISRLRRKIDSPGETPLIHTVRGAGYRLAESAGG